METKIKICLAVFLILIFSVSIFSVVYGDSFANKKIQIPEGYDICTFDSEGRFNGWSVSTTEVHSTVSVEAWRDYECQKPTKEYLKRQKEFEEDHNSTIKKEYTFMNANNS